RGKEGAIRQEGVRALPRRGREGAATVVPLLDDVPEELPLVVCLSLERRAVLRDRDEPLARELDDGGIAEDRLTAGHAVVSGTAQRVAVHRPQKDRLAGLYRDAAGIPDIRLPGNLPPACLVRSGPDVLDERPVIVT